jgi:protein involved in polysaccharide export with SLBB domain
VPKPPYHVRSGDELQIIAEPPEANLAARGFLVDPAGRIDLGPRYGKLAIGGQTVDEVTEAIKKVLESHYADPRVSVSVAQSAAMQPITGEHLVSPDGTVNLGMYGLVHLAGMTLPEAKQAVEKHLKAFLDQPEVAVSVFAYNSKVYYVIEDNVDKGDMVTRLTITGNETVLDALSQVNGLTGMKNKHIWIARPQTGGTATDTMIPVNWQEITAGAATATNYQVLPGDRIFIAEKPPQNRAAEGVNHFIGKER